MDPLKIVIFVAAFLLLLLLGKKLSGAEEIHPYQPPEPVRPLPVAAQAMEEEGGSAAKLPVATGADLPFPVALPELAMDEDGRYNRPEFVNYFFSKIDLVQGPPDPTAFIDDFFVETRDPEDALVMTYKYVACTPAGLQRVMDSEHLPSLLIEDSMVIVSRWNLPAILNAAVQEIMNDYHDSASLHAEEHALPESDESMS